MARVETVEITPDMTTAKINTALKNYRNVIFKAGTYRLTKCMKIYSNTTVTCEDGVVFERACSGRMLQANADPNVTGYNGEHDIMWFGGTFNAGTRSESANVITFFHCRNICLGRITITGCVGMHSIEINACKTVRIRDCMITNQTVVNGNDFREAIQIDFANKDGLTVSGAGGDAQCYDGTHCTDISIVDCLFRDVPNGIGTHTVSEKEDYHTDVIIDECDFSSILKYGIKLNGFKNVRIMDCNTPILVGTLTKAHKMSGGKVTIPERYNSNIVINNITVK